MTRMFLFKSKRKNSLHFFPSATHDFPEKETKNTPNCVHWGHLLLCFFATTEQIISSSPYGLHWALGSVASENQPLKSQCGHLHLGLLLQKHILMYSKSPPNEQQKLKSYAFPYADMA